jgi:S1-C subfamily serine protease
VCDDRPVNLFDLGAIVLLIVAVVLGYRSGALPQVGGLGGAIIGGGLAIVALPLVELAVASLDPWPKAIVVLGWLLVSVGIGEAVGSGLGRALALRLGRGVLGAMDQLAGGLLGAAQAVLIVWLAGGLMAVGPIPRVAAQAQTSTSVRTLAGVLPPPTEIAVELGRLLDASRLPDVFIGLEPVPAAPVERPSDPRAQAIAAAAAGSTVKVQAQTCGAISSGTGFAVAGDYIVTNAHVVAGGRTVRVILDGRPFDAITVLFDPDMDVAVLHVPELRARALRFAISDPERASEGAALGFPAAGELTAIPAAVAARYDAQGLDIYGRDRVNREILELRAAIERGDSGGPFVLVDGTVGGVVFAESRSDEDVGYALSPVAVGVKVGPAIGRTSPVDTGDCIR